MFRSDLVVTKGFKICGTARPDHSSSDCWETKAAVRELPFFVFLSAILCACCVCDSSPYFLCRRQDNRNLTRQGCISLTSSEVDGRVCGVTLLELRVLWIGRWDGAHSGGKWWAVSDVKSSHGSVWVNQAPSWLWVALTFLFSFFQQMLSVVF